MTARQLFTGGNKIRVAYLLRHLLGAPVVSGGFYRDKRVRELAIKNKKFSDFLTAAACFRARENRHNARAFHIPFSLMISAIRITRLSRNTGRV